MANTLLINKLTGGYFQFVLNGDTANAVRGIKNDLLAVGEQLHFKTGNGANIIKEQFIYPADLTIEASGTFTFTNVDQVWTKLIEIGYFDWINSGGSGTGASRFDDLLDTFKYTGKDGQVVIVNESQQKLQTVELYNYRTFTDLEDTPDLLLANKMVATNEAGTALIFKNLPEDPVNYLNSIGFFDYNDLGTQTTPISVTANTDTKLRNDTLGAYTNINYPPYGVSSLWDATTNRFNFTQLSIGDTIDVRIHLQVTTTTSNQTYKIGAKFGIGSASAFNNVIFTDQVKSAGVHEVSFVAPFYIGEANILNNPAELYINTDASASVKVDGWYIRILRRNINIINVETGVDDATTTVKGIVRLAGDLAGTATNPTVPALADKALKTTTITINGTTFDLSANREWNVSATATWGGITGLLSNQTDLQNALNAKEGTITAGTTSQYWRGDKTWQTLDKTAVGLGSVDNTTDLNKPISTATQTALNLRVPYTGATGNVDLGAYTLSAKDLVVNHSSGSGVAASITKGGSGEALTVVKSSGSGNAASITGGKTLISELNLTTSLADTYIASAANWNEAYSLRHAAVTLGTGNGLSLSGQQLSLGLASSSTTGALSSTDWNTFNNKQNALTNPITGTGTTNYLPKFTGSTSIGNSQIFDNGTNVGIGTTSPSEKLQVEGFIKIKNGAFNGGGIILDYYVPFTGSRSYRIINDAISTGDFSIQQSTNQTGSTYTDRFYINPSGNVGIGTTSPATLFQVRGNGSNMISLQYAADAGVAGYGFYNSAGTELWSIGGGRFVSQDALEFSRQGSLKMLINSSGNVLIGTTSDAGYKLDVNGTGRFSGNVTATGFFQSSDIRLKDIISRYGDVIKYKWKDKRDDKIHIGYVAQEILEVMPDAVSEDSEGMLSVNYIEVLVKKITEMEKEIAYLKSKL